MSEIVRDDKCMNTAAEHEEQTQLADIGRIEKFRQVNKIAKHLMDPGNSQGAHGQSVNLRLSLD